MKKRTVLILLAILLLIPVGAFADPKDGEKFPTVNVYVDGESIDTGEIRNDRTMVNIRKLAESLGFTVEYREEGKFIGISGKDKKLELQIGNNIAKVNGEEQSLDTPPFIKEDHTMVPLRFISEALGEKVRWNPEHYLVFVGEYRADLSGDTDGTVYSGYLDGTLQVPKGFFDEAKIKVIPEGDHEGFYLVHTPSEEALAKEYPEGFGGVMWRGIKSEKPEVFQSVPYYVIETREGDFITFAPESDMGFTEETAEGFKEVSERGEKLLRSIRFDEDAIPVEKAEKLLQDFGPKDLFTEKNLTVYYQEDGTVIDYSNYLLDDNFATLDAEAEIRLNKDNEIVFYSFKTFDPGETDYGREILDPEGGKSFVEQFRREVSEKDPAGIESAPDSGPSRYEGEAHEVYKDGDGGIYVVDVSRGILEYYSQAQ